MRDCGMRARAIDNIGYHAARRGATSRRRSRPVTAERARRDAGCRVARKARACFPERKPERRSPSTGSVLLPREHDVAVWHCRWKTRHATDCRSCHPRRFIPGVTPAIYRRPLRFISPVESFVRPQPCRRFERARRRHARRRDAN